MSAPRTQAPFAPLVVAAAILACFVPVLLGRCFLGGDLVNSFEPLARALADGLRHGDVLRTQRLFNGLPLLAHPVVAACYPPQLLVAVMEPARALTLLSLAHLAFAGTGACVLLRRMGMSAPAAAAGALAFALSGAAVSSMTQPNLVRALAWMPWTLVLAGEVARPDAGAAARPSETSGRARRAATLVALALTTTLLLLSAEPFIALPTLVGLAAILVPRPGEPRVAPVARVGIAMVAGALIAVPLLWPGVLYARESVRAAGFIPEAAAVWSLHPAQSLGMIVPRPFGDPRLAGLDGFAARSLVSSRSNEYFLSMYVGSLALGLAAAGLLAGARRERLAALGLVALVLLALGVHGPAQPLLDALGVDWLRYPVKWMLPAMLPLAVLVARGVEALGNASRRASGALVVAALPAAAVVILAAPLARFVASCATGEVSDAAREVIVTATGGRLLAGGTWSALAPLLLLLGAIMLRRAGRGALVPHAAVLMLAIDLGTQAQRTVPLTDARFYRSSAQAARAAKEQPSLQRLWLDLDSTRKAHPARTPRTMRDILSWQREILMHYTASSAGVALAFPTDVEALSPLRIEQLSMLVTSSAWRERLMLLGAAGVTHVATMDAPETDLLQPAVAIPTSGAVPMRLMRNRLALPRARVVPAIRLFGGSAEFEDILRSSPADLFARTTLVSRNDWESFAAGATPPAAEAPAGWQGSARIVEERCSAMHLVVETDGAGGALVVSDAWLPGLSATVDGAAAASFPADHAFTGVIVPAGRHEVDIAYNPWRSR